MQNENPEVTDKRKVAEAVSEAVAAQVAEAKAETPPESPLVPPAPPLPARQTPEMLMMVHRNEMAERAIERYALQQERDRIDARIAEIDRRLGELGVILKTIDVMTPPPESPSGQ